MSPEEARLTGQANNLVENNLSSVKIMRNTKGTTWEVKVKHEDPYKALSVAQFIDEEMRKKYGSN